MKSEEPRSLNDAELSIIHLLLTDDIPRAEELRAHVSRARVVRTCECGCPTMEMDVSDDPRSQDRREPHYPIPSEGRVSPLESGPPGEILFFVDDDGLSCLEYVFKDPPSSEWPSLDRITVVGNR